MQKGDKTLKQIADELGINYSTAKTIVQTFRKERRVAKLSKKLTETKKSIRHETYLAQFLTRYKVAKFIFFILDEELVSTKKAEAPLQINHRHSQTHDSLHPLQLFSIEKVDPTQYESQGTGNKFLSIEKGPKLGQVTVGTYANLYSKDPLTHKKDVFYVYTETDPEAKYKEKINYEDPVILNSKQINHELYNSKEPNYDPSEPEFRPHFSFTEYGTWIMESNYMR